MDHRTSESADSIDAAQQHALAAICLMAAFADGNQSDAERERIRSVCTDLADADAALPALYRKVLLGESTLEGEAAGLLEPAVRRLAYEMAVCVCDADGVSTDREREFLDTLRRALELEEDGAEATLARADALAVADDDVLVDLIGGEEPAPLAPASTAAVASESAADGLRSSSDVDAAIDAIIRRYAGIAAAMEMLPQSLATVAILPLQSRMVYLIGQQHGHGLDAGHIKEFIATVGVGMTAQAVEGFFRKLLGGLARRLLGGFAGILVGAGTGAATTFATTWALGQVARAYYGADRSLSVDELQRVFTEQLPLGRETYRSAQSSIERDATRLAAGAPMRTLEQ